ncbi:MAG: hypothetical protein U0271_33315 [Polyangiaceae bacterium]
MSPRERTQPRPPRAARYLRWCAVLYRVLAWLGLAAAALTLFTVDILDSKTLPTKEGIGGKGVLTILLAAAVGFVFMEGLSQMAQLVLQMHDRPARAIVSSGLRGRARSRFARRRCSKTQ